ILPATSRTAGRGSPTRATRVADLLHQTFGQGSCWVRRRGCLRLLGRGRSGFALAASAVAQALLRLRGQESSVRLALVPLRGHRVASDSLRGRNGSALRRSCEAWLDLPPAGGRPGGRAGYYGLG